MGKEATETYSAKGQLFKVKLGYPVSIEISRSQRKLGEDGFVELPSGHEIEVVAEDCLGQRKMNFYYQLRPGLGVQIPPAAILTITKSEEST